MLSQLSYRPPKVMQDSDFPARSKVPMGLMLAAMAVQVTIFVAARFVDGRGLVEVMGSAINGAFIFWEVGVVLVLILSFFERLIP